MTSACYRANPGWLKILAENEKITAVRFVSKKSPDPKKLPPVLKRALREIDQYFKGARRYFSVPIRAKGTLFQKKVWKALLRIPYGEVASYQSVANTIGRPKAARAVAGAVGANPVCVLVPCHRVIGKDGALTGYAYGLNKKSALLRLEK